MSSVIDTKVAHPSPANTKGQMITSNLVPEVTIIFLILFFLSNCLILKKRKTEITSKEIISKQTQKNERKCSLLFGIDIFIGYDCAVSVLPRFCFGAVSSQKDSFCSLSTDAQLSVCGFYFRCGKSVLLLFFSLFHVLLHYAF